MNTKHYTSIEQSKKLLELGLSPETADMWYQHTGISIKDGSQKPIYFPMVIRDCESDEDIPCWSVGALINILPESIFIENVGSCDLIISKVKSGYYIHYDCDIQNEKVYVISGACKTLIEAVYNMMVWLLENKYIKQ